MEESTQRKRPCTKRFRLALWWLTYRLPVLDGVDREAEEQARTDWGDRHVLTKELEGTARKALEAALARVAVDFAALESDVVGAAPERTADTLDAYVAPRLQGAAAERAEFRAVSASRAVELRSEEDKFSQILQK